MLQSMGSQRVRHTLVTEQQQQKCVLEKSIMQKESRDPEEVTSWAGDDDIHVEMYSIDTLIFHSSSKYLLSTYYVHQSLYHIFQLDYLGPTCM